MGKIAKSVMVSLYLLLFVIYTISAYTVKSTQDARQDEYERNTAFYDLKREQLYRQLTSLQTTRIDLMNNLEMGLLEAQRRKQLEDALSNMPKAPTLNQTTVSAPSPLENVTAPPVQPIQILDQLKKIQQVQAKTSSTTSTRRTTRAS